MVDYCTIVPECPVLKSTLKSVICPRQIVIYAGAIEKTEDLINLVTSAFQRKMYKLFLRLIQAYSLKDGYRAKAQSSVENPSWYLPDSICHLSAFSLSVVRETPYKINKVQTTTEDTAHRAEQHQLAVVRRSCAQGTLNFFHHLEVTMRSSGQEHFGYRILQSTF